MSFKSNAFIAAIAAMSWCMAPAALSQEPGEEFEEPTQSQDLDDPTQSQSTADDLDRDAAEATADAGAIDDKKIEQFANAYVEVQTIQQKAASELQTAKDPDAADKVRTSAETDMIAAVERNGLKVDEFNQIVETMASNVEVRNKVAAKLQQRSGG